jgi:vitamin B12 transporter
VALGVTAYRQRLKDEIVGTFNSSTFIAGVANASGTSRREGIEAEAEWRPLEALGVTATYRFVNAEEQQVAEGCTREGQATAPQWVFRAGRHLGQLRAGPRSPMSVSGRISTSTPPARRVTLQDYVLADARIAYQITDTQERSAACLTLRRRLSGRGGYATQGARSMPASGRASGTRADV